MLNIRPIWSRLKNEINYIPKLNISNNELTSVPNFNLLNLQVLNISFNNGTFDVGIRAYNDTDANPVYLEKFTNCSLNPGSNSFVGVKIGTSDGEYAVRSKYVMLEMNEDAPANALPCGFEGYNFRLYDDKTSFEKINFLATVMNATIPASSGWNPFEFGSAVSFSNPFNWLVIELGWYAGRMAS